MCIFWINFHSLSKKNSTAPRQIFLMSFSFIHNIHVTYYVFYGFYKSQTEE